MFKNKVTKPDQAAFLAFLEQRYRSMPPDELRTMCDNLVAQLTLINSIIEEKCPDQEVQ